MSYEQGSFGEYQFASAVPQVNPMPAGFVRYWEIGEQRELMQQLESFLDTVLETGQVPFEIRHQYGREHAVRNPVGIAGYRSLSGFLPLCGRWMDLYWPGYAYSADIQLLFDCFMQHPFAQVFGYGAPMSIIDKPVAANLYNDFVGYLRMEAVRWGVRKGLTDWRANIDEQAGSIGRYLGNVLSRHSHLVPIRVDFNYAEDAFDGTDAMPRTGWSVTDGGVWRPVPSHLPVSHGRAETRSRIDTAAAMADRDRFFGNQRGADKHLFERMAGYVCKLEQGGQRRANHFHCVFLIDATGLSEAELQAIKYGLGDRWRRVTGGQGMMFDCHESPYRQALEAQGRWAINPVDCADPVKVATFINYVSGYFAKDDNQMVRVKPMAKARTLTMGR